MTHRAFNGMFPQPSDLDEHDTELMDRINKTLSEADRQLGLCNFRHALNTIMGLAQETNRYIDLKAPWLTRKTDLPRTGTTLWVCISVLSCLRTVTHPFLPFSSQKLHELLGFTGRVEDLGWQLQEIKVGQSFPEPTPLFTKLEESVAAEELEHLRSQST